MYGGSITRKAEKLDNALQKLAAIFAKFAKAVDVQETYLDKTRTLLNYLDLLLDTKLDDFKAKCRTALHANNNEKEEKELILFIDKFEHQMKVEVVNQHVFWIRSLFDQFQLLDHRFAITDSEYTTLKSKLPEKSKQLFERLTGVDRRMKQLADGIRVLPYSDLNALINKVIEDLQVEMLAYLFTF
ncbi:hypothetical protein RFI_26374 [Reticulomyxa filosa]|uniref:Uncharacterized protein n=1 Tax=Reticulomyxa filosa TaxID=46433 RepID=X6MC36_RETFI|nr:hypothetical protein RFI_26374 [Reticulomyxa filosa]|eukprot:ETO11002.1 hypothetical protein RFI_26374 [Reticulomyxa filosa]